MTSGSIVVNFLNNSSFTTLMAFREKLNYMNHLLYMAPKAMVVLLPATLQMEKNVIRTTMDLARNDIRIIAYLLFGSSLAYFVNLTNFLVTKHTSALTLQVYPNTIFPVNAFGGLLLCQACWLSRHWMIWQMNDSYEIVSKVRK